MRDYVSFVGYNSMLAGRPGTSVLRGYEEVPTMAGVGERTVPLIPEVGNVVNVRGSVWAVTDVRVQGLDRSPADEVSGRLQHEVSLQSLAEDRMGEELSVVWELEVGCFIVQEQGLPESVDPQRFDDPNTLGAFVDAMRWGAVTNADDRAFQSPFRTGANLEPYQLEPLRRALSAPRTNLLLADDVGLGKTIEAGLVLEELLLRHRARTVIIVCPPSLRVKWQDEMREKFGLEFQIVDSAAIAEARRTFGLAANPFRLYPRVIVSMDWLSMPRAQRMLNEVYAEARSADTARSYAFDALVVDEAHHVAPAAPTAAGGGRGYAVDSKRTVAVRELAVMCEHRLFLSATPHNGYTESFTALLEMVDSRRFSRGANVDQKALSEVTVRRLKTDIAERGFKKRVIKSIPFDTEPGEEQRYSKLCDLLKESAGAKGAKRSLGIAALLLQKRFLSSPWAFSRTLEGYMAAPDDAFDWDDCEDYYYEVMGSGQSDMEEGLDTQPECEALCRAKSDGPLSAASDADLRGLADWGAGYEARANSRLKALEGYLDSVCRPEGKWSDERVVVFTEYADTLSWMLTVLRAAGYDEDRLAVIQGATESDERELVRARFCADPAEEPVRVLLATDAAGEGIDLQDWCHRLVNFDVPFNPSRLEQRIGRIDRYGQRCVPEIFYFEPTGSSSGMLAGELSFMGRIAGKVATTLHDLGAANQLIDDEVFEHYTRTKRNRAATRGQRASEDAINRALAGGMELNRQLTELERGYERSREALHISPEAERRVVDVALRLTNQPSLEPVPGKPGAFRIPPLNDSWKSVKRGLCTRLRPDVVRPVTFDGEAAKSDPGLVYVHLGSALVRKASRTLRGNLYGTSGGLNRVTALVVPGLETTCAAAVARLVLVGRGGLRVHEEVFVAGIRFRGSNMAEGKGLELLDGALDVGELELAGPAVLGHLSRMWSASGGHMRTRLEQEVERRAVTRKDAVAESLKAREEGEVERVGGIYAAFAENLRQSLDDLREEDGAQLMLDLWPDEQRRQRQRDMKAIEGRLDTLADERERELALVRERYRDIRPYCTIAALVFAVSPQDADEWKED